MLAKHYAMILLGVLLLSSFALVYHQPSFFISGFFIKAPYQAPVDSKFINATWVEFINDCGGEVIVENYIHARSVFNKKYENNIIEWTGHFTEGVSS